MIYHAADELSGRGQRRTKAMVRTELVNLILASAAGVSTLRIGSHRLDILAALSAFFFLTALSSTVIRSFTKPESAWYIGRAAAESVRTLAWQYAMGARSFPCSRSEAEAGQTYLDRIRDVLHELQQLTLPEASLTAHELIASEDRSPGTNSALLAMPDVRGSG